MSSATVTIKEAIRIGEKLIMRPARIIHIASWVLLIVLLLLGFSWWNLLLIPGGAVLSLIYTTWVTHRWRKWAYKKVVDVHQFQRSAELAGLLMRKSTTRAGWFQSNEQKRRTMELLNRFAEESEFSDDTSVPDDTTLFVETFYPETGDRIILNSDGISVPPEGFYEWNVVENERVARVSFKRMHPGTGLYNSAGWGNFFRFECPKGRFDMPLLSLNMPAWELDLLLYIYRGRYNQARSMGKLTIGRKSGDLLPEKT